MGIEAGRLNRRVTILRPLYAESDTGERKVTGWEEVSTRWAEAIPLNASEVVRARQAQLMTTHQITMRYTTDVDSACRLRWERGGLTHLISLQNVIQDDRKESTVCIGIEVKDG